MRKILLFILSLSFFLVVTSPVSAVNNATSAPEKTNLIQKRETKSETIQEKVASIEAKLSARKKAIIRNYFTVMTRRLEAAINRLNRLIIRIESRIAKIEANNEDINTKPIKKDIADARSKLGAATDKLEAANTQIDEILDSSTPKEGFMKIKDMIAEIKQDLIDTHQLLVKIIGEIKGLRVGNITTPSATVKE